MDLISLSFLAQLASSVGAIPTRVHRSGECWACGQGAQAAEGYDGLSFPSLKWASRRVSDLLRAARK